MDKMHVLFCISHLDRYIATELRKLDVHKHALYRFVNAVDKVTLSKLSYTDVSRTQRILVFVSKRSN